MVAHGLGTQHKHKSNISIVVSGATRSHLMLTRSGYRRVPPQLENSATGGQAGGIPGAPEARRERTGSNRRLKKQVAVLTALGERGSRSPQ
jgi:hypothetical protein